MNEALEILKQGGVLLHLTDTVWGLACDATNIEAVQKVYAIKQRDENKPMLILVDNDRRLERHVKQVPDIAWDLIDHADKPLTIIFQDAVGLPQSVLGSDGSIAIRIVNDETCKQLIRKLNRPLLSTSANLSGEPTPVRFGDVSEAIRNQVDYILESDDDSREEKASSIIKLGTDGEIQIIRK